MTTSLELDRLLDEVEATRFGNDQWCPPEKQRRLAELVFERRPRVIVEIGVWQGASLIPMLIALKHNADRGFPGIAFAIDPWLLAESQKDESAQIAELYATLDHNAALEVFKERLARTRTTLMCSIERVTSSQFELWRLGGGLVDPRIDLLHIDGAHTDQADRDVAKFAPLIATGGLLVIDDLVWDGGGPMRGYQRALEMGFVNLFLLGTGCVMQRGPHKGPA